MQSLKALHGPHALLFVRQQSQCSLLLNTVPLFTSSSEVLLNPMSPYMVILFTTKPHSLSTPSLTALINYTRFLTNTQSELLSLRGSLEEQQHVAESAQAQIEEKERSELELKVEIDALKEELDRLRSLEETLLSRVAGKDKKITHLEEKIGDLKEVRTKRADVVSSVGSVPHPLHTHAHTHTHTLSS